MHRGSEVLWAAEAIRRPRWRGRPLIALREVTHQRTRAARRAGIYATSSGAIGERVKCTKRGALSGVDGLDVRADVAATASSGGPARCLRNTLPAPTPNMERSHAQG